MREDITTRIPPRCGGSINAIDDLDNIEYKDKYLTIKKRFVENN